MQYRPHAGELRRSPKPNQKSPRQNQPNLTKSALKAKSPSASQMATPDRGRYLSKHNDSLEVADFEQQVEQQKEYAQNLKDLNAEYMKIIQ